MPKSKKIWDFKKFWNFKSKDEKIGELTLYGEIASGTWWGDEITPKQFKDDMDALGDIDTLNVYINSPGGDVFAGQAIRSMLIRHKANVNVYIDGLAASIASVIATAGVVTMPKNTMMMIHNPWTIAVGNAEDFRKMADDLDKITESLIAAYLEKTGDKLEREKLQEMMEAETWLTAEEAVKYGLADVLEEAVQVAACADSGFLSKYKNTPAEILEKIDPEPEQKPEPDKEVKDKELELIKQKMSIELEL